MSDEYRNAWQVAADMALGRAVGFKVAEADTMVVQIPEPVGMPKGYPPKPDHPPELETEPPPYVPPPEEQEQPEAAAWFGPGVYRMNMAAAAVEDGLIRSQYDDDDPGDATAKPLPAGEMRARRLAYEQGERDERDRWVRKVTDLLRGMQ